jgi:hypothetical protein
VHVLRMRGTTYWQQIHSKEGGDFYMATNTTGNKYMPTRMRHHLGPIWAAQSCTTPLRISPFTLVGSDVETSLSCTWLSGTFGSSVICRTFLAISSSMQIRSPIDFMHYAPYLDHVLTVEQRGPAAIYPWYAAPTYM